MNYFLLMSLRKWLSIGALIGHFAFCGAASATTEVDSETILASQRYHYQKAKTALSQGDLKGFEQHYQQLGDYPLKQYLDFGLVRRNLNALPYDEIDAFLEQYQGTFLSTRLRARVLQILAQKKLWPEYLKYYEPAFKSVALRCHALYARVKTGDSSAFDEVPPLWDIGQSQDSACDPLFAEWRKSGLLTEELVWNRFDKAMNSQQTGLARYLSRKLDKYADSAKLYFQVQQNPRLVTNLEEFRRQDLPTQHIIAYGIKRLARQQPLDALYHWELYEAQQLFPATLGLDTKLYVVQRLIRGGHTDAAQHLLSYSHQLRETDLIESLIRDALADLNWQRVHKTIMLLGREDQQTDRWLYWHARAQDELNTRLPGLASSEAIYETLARNRSFYGFLAADKLLTNYALMDDSAPAETELTHSISQLADMRRINELWLTGNLREARAEWLHSSRQMTPEQLIAAGQLTRDWGWYNSGIQAMISGNLWNQLTVRFPLAYREHIDRAAQDTDLDPTLLYAIARQESAFDASALSPAGAMGLMQLMPRTASYTAKFANIPHSTRQDLLKPEHNVLLGSHYLNHLLEQFDGNRILAAAAYNAGPHRVNTWLNAQTNERPFDVWIETIPFRETRHYVQNVLAYSVIYGYRLGQPVAMVSEEEINRRL